MAQLPGHGSYPRDRDIPKFRLRKVFVKETKVAGKKHTEEINKEEGR